LIIKYFQILNFWSNILWCGFKSFCPLFHFRTKKGKKKKKIISAKILEERKHFFGASQELKAAYKIKEDGVPVSRG